MPILRDLASFAVATPPLAAALRRFTCQSAAVFMFHRFQHSAVTAGAFSPATLRRLLAYLRQKKYRLEDIDTVVRAYREDPDALSGMVAFTVDDGYAEFAAVAAPIFAEFDCPVAVFLPTDFVDGTCWMWWDQILYAFYESPRRSLRHEQFTHNACWSWTDGSSARIAALPLIRSLQRVPPAFLAAALAALASALDVEIPGRPPAQFAAMSWDTIRRLGRRGVSFGAHTRTHPTLSQLSDAEARAEIVGSWVRLNEETDAVSRVFAYPIGTAQDAGEREAGMVEAAGMIGAVSTVADHVTPSCRSAYLLPRFSPPESIAELRVLVGGLERAKEEFRQRHRPRTF